MDGSDPMDVRCLSLVLQGIVARDRYGIPRNQPKASIAVWNRRKAENADDALKPRRSWVPPSDIRIIWTRLLDDWCVHVAPAVRKSRFSRSTARAQSFRAAFGAPQGLADLLKREILAIAQLDDPAIFVG